MLPERIGEAAKSGDIETIRAYFEDDSDGDPRFPFEVRNSPKRGVRDCSAEGGRVT